MVDEQARADPAETHDMPQVGTEAVADVDGGVDPAVGCQKTAFAQKGLWSKVSVWSNVMQLLRYSQMKHGSG